MRVTISAATLIAWASVALAQTPGFDAILTPGLHENVAAGSTYTIKWEPSTAYQGAVTIQLMEGATPSTLQLGAVVGSSVDSAAGSFSWTVDPTLGADATYGIKIYLDKNHDTFQYSNPFHIIKAAASSVATSSAASSSAAPTTAAPATTTAPAAVEDSDSTIYSTEWKTITSCAASITNCPARSTVTSSTVRPVQTTVPAVGATAATSVPVVASASAPAVSAPAQKPSTAVASSAKTTLLPVYPVGNATTTGSAAGTGAYGASPTSSIVAAGAGRVATGSIAVVAGLMAAFFAL